MLRVAIVSKKGNMFSLNGTREAIDNLLLSVDSEEGLKIYRIICIETKEVIEKWSI
jgi:hypothetical protein